MDSVVAALVIWLIGPTLIRIVWKATRGIRGEMRVNRRLAANDYPVLHDLKLRDHLGVTQIDQVVLTPAGLVVIETKNYAGDIECDDGPTWVQYLGTRTSVFQNPVRQNYRHLQAVRAHVPRSIPVHGLVVFVGSAHLRGAPPDVIYLSGLRAWMERRSQFPASVETSAMRGAFASLRTSDVRYKEVTPAITKEDRRNEGRFADREHNWSVVKAVEAIFDRPKNGARIDLHVPYAEKDDAKERGARWDPQFRTWYVPESHSPDDFRRWLPETELVIFEVPQTEHALATARGASHFEGDRFCTSRYIYGPMKFERWLRARLPVAFTNETARVEALMEAQVWPLADDEASIAEAVMAGDPDWYLSQHGYRRKVWDTY